MKKDEVLFKAFEMVAGEINGIVTRGGIFTASHPRLKGTMENKEINIFFQKEKQATNLCLRLSGDFPFSMEILPRFKSIEINRIHGDSRTDENQLSLPVPFSENFMVKSQEGDKCSKFVNSELFRESFQEILSPLVLEQKFLEEFQIKDEDASEKERLLYRETDDGYMNIFIELDELEIPKQRFFFYPQLVLDKKGAFLRIRFDHYHNAPDSHPKRGPDALEIKEVIMAYMKVLNSLLEYKGLPS